MTWPLAVFDWWDAGDGVKLARFTGGPDNHFVGTGVAWAHPSEDEQEGFCIGTLQYDIPENTAWRGSPQWQLTQLDPLTLSPSILCTAHRDWHGFIWDGRWVKAGGSFPAPSTPETT
jgi:hypothetical protein